MEESKQNNNKNTRLFEIVRVLNTYNVLVNFAKKINPQEVKEAFEELGPTFIKIGQILSLREDILTKEYVEEFKKLQDDVKNDDFSFIKEEIENRTGIDIYELFEEFEEEPLASASIGQVHFGKLKSGKKVVVKVQHPGIYEKMVTDIELLEKAIPLIKFIPVANTVNLDDIVEEIKQSLMIELDFNNEANNIEQFFKNNDDPNILSPQVYKQYSDEKLLIMDYMEGVKISEYSKKTELSNIKKKLADILINNYIKQIFIDGFFHADPHPGNILVYEENLVYLDFGMMGKLDEKTIEKLNQVVLGLAEQDNEKIVKAIVNLCSHTREIDMDVLNDDVEKLFSKYYEMSIGDMNLADIFNNVTNICTKNSLILPSNVTLLFKGVSTIEGVVLQLDPNISFMGAIEPYAYRHLMSQMDIEKEAKQLLVNLSKIIKVAPESPLKISKLIDDIIKGKLKINLDDSFKILDMAFNKLSLSLIIGALIIGSSILMAFERGYKVSIIGFSMALILTLIMVYYIFKKK